jgi:DNA-directed RNA polymerase beta' subunit
VGVPEEVARVMTYPEVVTAANYGRMKALVMRGGNAHPGANHLRSPGAPPVDLRVANDRRRAELAGRLAIGDVVERCVAPPRGGCKEGGVGGG